MGYLFRGTLIIPVLLAGSALPLFEDRATAWKLDQPTVYGNNTNATHLIESLGSGAVIFDADGDLRNDLLLLNAGRAPYLYRNLGNGAFEDVAAKAGLTEKGWAQAACAGDIDNDGDLDLVITYHGYNRLYRNSGGKFEDITAASGLPTTGKRWGAGCALLDFNRDGRLDLFVANYVDMALENPPKPGSRAECLWKDLPVVCGPRGLPKALNALYQQTADGKFIDVSARAGILKPGARYGLGVAAADLNNDGWPDIYVACDQTPSLLYENQRNGTFVERALEAGVALDSSGREQAGMGIAIGDFDNSGTLDIAKTNFSGDMPSLYLNEDGTFYRDIAAQAGLGRNMLLGWGIAFVDQDADGWLDLMMANGHVYPEVDRAQFGERFRQPTLLYRNLGNLRFADLSATAGPAVSQPKSSRGLAIGDLNGDGRPEIVLSNRNDAPTILEATGPRGNLLKITLAGTKSNRSAIGARVTIQAGGRKQMAELGAGSSFYSQHELALYFGLGAATEATTVTVRWPNGTTEIWRNVSAATPQHLVEGKSR